ncbi:putative solute-binding protein [Agitococcus lubricus]|uniref:TRAP-type C4-dicarboxylate transport system substrate-binding protein n=1 Tax=Agitococcus lubricus TaxID=1077255 RepID=A0A2T5J1V3_9GAMM|nr:putative solute-binding protein [Agitococcus lubricus]PTQ90422.1 hypothetical protein C8N29_103175 [Agitococcus lubricus]
MFKNLALSAAMGFTLLATSTQAAAVEPMPFGKTVKMRFCIFDIAGTKGDAYNYAKDLVLEAKKWNLDVDLKVYTDERIAAEDFKAGQCEGVAISTMRAKQFNFFIGSVDSPGALPTFKHVRELVNTLANPKLNNLTINGPYQVAAVIPLGAAYVFVNDRRIDSVEKAAGKKVAVLDFDKAQAKIIQKLGAQPVSSDITNFAGKFNNGQVDIIGAPALAYRPLELYRGLGDKGAIFRFPLLQVTASIIINRDKFKDIPDFDARVIKMREFATTKIDMIEKMVQKSEADIPAKYWLDLTPADKEKYTLLMREARISMMKEGFYDPKMLSILKKIRCKFDPANSECSLKDE